MGKNLHPLDGLLVVSFIPMADVAAAFLEATDKI